MFLLYSTTVGSAAPQIPTAGGSLAEIRTRDWVTKWQVCYQLMSLRRCGVSHWGWDGSLGMWCLLQDVVSHLGMWWFIENVVTFKG